MSGPVFLSPEQIRMRAEAEERLRLVQDQFRKSESVKRLMNGIEDVQKILAQVAEISCAKEISRKLSAFTRQCQRALDKWESLSSTTRNEELRQYNAELDQILEAIPSQVEKLRAEAVSVRDSYVKGLLRSIPVPEEHRTGMEDARILVFERPEIPPELVRTENARLLEQLDSMKSRADRIKALRGTDFSALRAEIKDISGTGRRDNGMVYQDLHQLDVMVLQPLNNKLEEAEAAWDRLDQELSRELAVYHAVCAEYGIVPRAFTFRPQSVQEIRYATADILQHHCLTVNCKEIIDRVRGILIGLGYAYIGEKEEDRQVVRHIYRIHDRSILHVIFDSTGRVTMEVAMESEEDRTPSGREAQQIVSDQGAFCKGFEHLLECLNRDGLAMKKDMLCPGGEEYAQMISTSGFTKAPESRTSFDYSIYEMPEKKYLEMR